MLFSSPTFLFAFLPINLLIYFLLPPSCIRLKNIVLLLFSLLFYAWGEVFYVLVMLLSIFTNYVIGRCIFRDKHSAFYKNFWLSVGITLNLLLLISFKYANFIIDNINTLLTISGSTLTFHLAPIHLPLGISFFTFQAISYIVDIYRDEVPAQKSLINLALYISLFPQLIAGPIVRYHDIAKQISKRTHSIDTFSYGVQRFIYGLAKKMLIANPLGEVADSIFILSGDELTMPLAWIGILSYTLQIFFDFSGYSDMAIGLGRMFGFNFLENFNYPYISTSIREFWRRWHISLSTWFRDYVYIPLGGGRVCAARVYFNLLFVFILTGFWHGASWNFMIWGLFHGFFITCEHAGFSRILIKFWKPIQHIYVLLIVIIGWVFFRIEELSDALNYIKTMIDFTNFQTTGLEFARVISYEGVYAFIAGIIISMPTSHLLKRTVTKRCGESIIKAFLCINIPKLLLLMLLFAMCILKISSSTYNPFIYFRF